MEARLLSADSVEASPGDVVNASFRVTNTSSTEEEFEESLTLPEGWQPILPAGVFTLKPGEALPRIVSFAVLRSAAAGTSEVLYSVRSRRDLAIQDQATLTVSIRAVTKLALLVMECPERVMAGQEYTASLQVLNQGNAALEVELEARGGSEFPLRLDRSRVTVAPNASETVTVTVETRKTVAQAFKHTVYVVASAGTEKATQTMLVEVVPQGDQRVDPFHRIPAKIAMRAQVGGDGTSAQMELSGHGTLQEKGTAEVEFLLRGPDTQGTGYQGQRSEYWMNYTSRDLSLMLGDQSYSLSELTDYAEYGRGAGWSVRPVDGLEVGGHYVASRWRQPGEEAIGAYASGALGDDVELRVNLLDRNGRETGSGPPVEDTIWSIQGEARPFEGLHVEAEYGASRTRAERRIGQGSALRMELDGTIKGGTHYSLSKTHADPDFRGAYRDFDSLSGTLSIPFGARARMQASYRSVRQNLDLCPELRRAPDERMLTAGFFVPISKVWSTSLEYEMSRYRDRLTPPAFDRETHVARLGMGCAADNLSARLTVRLGWQHDAVDGRRESVTQATLSGSYRPAPGRVFTLYGAAGTDDASDARLLSGGTNLGASALWAFNDRLNVQLNYLAYSSEGPANQGQLTTTYTRPDETEWVLQLRRAPSFLRRGSGTSVLLSYTRPLQLPVGRRTSIGGIRGVVYDALDETHPGVPQAIVATGGWSSAADRVGRFALGNLQPGTYVVSLDPGSVGLDRVPVEAFPKTVDVAPGRFTQVDIGLTRAARLEGRVIVRVPEPPASTEGGSDAYVVGSPEAGAQPGDNTGLGGVLVEMALEGDVQRRVSEQDGRFTFERLRPGVWRLKAYDYNLPQYHVLVTPETDVELGPGDAEEVEIVVAPQQRRIRMTDDGGEPDVIRLNDSPTATPANSAPPTPDDRGVTPSSPAQYVPTPGDLREGYSAGQTQTPRRVLSRQDALRSRPASGRR